MENCEYLGIKEFGQFNWDSIHFLSRRGIQKNFEKFHKMGEISCFLIGSILSFWGPKPLVPILKRHINFDRTNFRSFALSWSSEIMPKNGYSVITVISFSVAHNNKYNFEYVLNNKIIFNRRKKNSKVQFLLITSFIALRAYI